MLRQLLKARIDIDIEQYCASHNVHPENAKLMLKVARNLPRNTTCTAQDIAVSLCVGVIDESHSQDAIYGARR